MFPIFRVFLWEQLLRYAVLCKPIRCVVVCFQLAKQFINIIFSIHYSHFWGFSCLATRLEVGNPPTCHITYREWGNQLNNYTIMRFFFTNIYIFLQLQFCWCTSKSRLGLVLLKLWGLNYNTIAGSDYHKMIIRKRVFHYHQAYSGNGNVGTCNSYSPILAHWRLTHCLLGDVVAILKCYLGTHVADYVHEHLL